jgi:hypothetical protein
MMMMMMDVIVMTVIHIMLQGYYKLQKAVSVV